MVKEERLKIMEDESKGLISFENLNRSYNGSNVYFNIYMYKFKFNYSYFL